MPRPEDFAERARFRIVQGQIQAELDGTVYHVDPYGDDAVQILDPATTEPVAVFTLEDGKFVVPGHD